MQPIDKPITGNEIQEDCRWPYNALVQFYSAFNRRDMGQMSQNWHQSNQITMDNPIGGIKRGWDEIREVYRNIFHSPAEVYLEFYDYTLHETNEIFYTVGREKGFFRHGQDEIKLAIRTSRIFRRVEGIWQQVHHHGSIEDPNLLKRYQQAILG